MAASANLVAKKPKLKRKKTMADRIFDRESPDNNLVRQDSKPNFDIEALLTGVSGRVSDMGNMLTYSPVELEKPRPSYKLTRKATLARKSPSRPRNLGPLPEIPENIPYRVNMPANDIPKDNRRGGVFIAPEPTEEDPHPLRNKPRRVELVKARIKTEEKEPKQAPILEVLRMEPSKGKSKVVENRLDPSKARVAIFRSR